jgi:predicted deacetylase
VRYAQRVGVPLRQLDVRNIDNSPVLNVILRDLNLKKKLKCLKQHFRGVEQLALNRFNLV